MSWSWSGQRVLVTGGASHIGSTIVEKLAEREHRQLLRIADNFSHRYPPRTSNPCCSAGTSR